MDKDLKKGTRIYYSGDMANEEGLGVITRRIKDQFGTFVDIRMDDKRFLPLISVTAFSDKYLGHGGTRFVTEEAYTDWRQDQINKVEATLAKNDAERSSEAAEDEIDDALVPKYAIQPLRTAVLEKFAKGEIDMKELARKELESRGVKVETVVSDDRLDAMLEDASREAEKRGESDERQIYDVWKDETSYQGLKWKVQLKSGVNSFKTKKAATAAAEEWKKVDAEAKKAQDAIDKIKASAIELRCKTCSNWNLPEDFRDGYSNTYGYILICPKCKAWNTGGIESRPVQRSRKISVEGIVRDRKGPKADPKGERFMRHELSTDRWYVYVHNAKNDYEPKYPGITGFPAYSFPLAVRQHFSQALLIVIDIYEEMDPGEEVSYTIVER